MRHTLKIATMAVIFVTATAVQAEEMPSTQLDYTSSQPVSLSITSSEGETLPLSIVDPIDKDKKDDEEVKKVFIERNEKVYIRLDNPSMNTIDIEVRDGFERIIYTEKIKKTEDVLKSLNFKEAYKGYYTIKVSDGVQTYSKEIAIR